MIIRTAALSDAAAIRAIYAPYVENTAVTFEYDVPTEAEFVRRIGATLEKYPYLVAEDAGTVIGYAYASPFKSRAAYQRACEVSIYVKEGCHHRGTGKLLYQALEEILLRQHIHTLNACITWPNEQSVRFHEACGYTLCAHFHESGYKFGRWLDVVWMEKRLPADDPPLPFVPYSSLR